MLNKEQLETEIEALPKFEMKEIAVKDNKKFVVQEDLAAITEEGKNVALSTVSKGYNLIQFKDIFLPVVEKIGKDSKEVQGECDYFGGKSLVHIFPDGRNIGLTLKNSVNKQWAISVNFSTVVKDYVVTLPLRRWRKIHIGQAEVATKDFVEILDSVKTEWDAIVDNFKKYQVTADIAVGLEDVFGKRVIDRILKRIEYMEEVSNGKMGMNLWDTFLSGINDIVSRKYKSEIHKKEKLDAIASKIIDYAITTKIIGDQ